MISVEDAKELESGVMLYHETLTNADGSAQRFKVIGKPKVWKTRPNDVLVSVKRGMYEYYKLDAKDLKHFNF